jgi:hypothetical protein
MATLLSGPAFAQFLGGREAFTFTRLPVNAPVAALGGITTSLTTRNPTILLSNPALLNKESAGQLAVTYSPYYADIRHTSAGYAHEFTRGGLWGASVQYVDYGTFEETDASGNVLGSFVARDYLLALGHARTINQFTLGANLKFAGSAIATYGASALMADIGGQFTHPEQDLIIGLLIKNAGISLGQYIPGQSLPLPFDVQIGTSFKPKFMPVRFSLTAHRLHQPDIAYDDPALNTFIDPDGNRVVQQVGLVDKIFRHFVFGTEVLLSQNVHLIAGYNHLVRQELKLDTRAAGAGLSFGALIRVKAFEISYARAYHHAVGGTSYITLVSNMRTIIRKKDTKG